jgi:predicted amidohydrolase
LKAVKVATTQISVKGDVEKNLSKCLKMIDEAAKNCAELVVFPEFTNISRESANDQKSMYEIAEKVPGRFIDKVAESAAKSKLFVVLPMAAKGEKPYQVFDATFLIGPDGRKIGEYQKTVLHREECDLFLIGQRGLPVFDTSIGRIGLYSCMDGIIPETSRVLALKGAQILVNSLNSGAREEASYIIPSRAVENRAWVVSSNKAGVVIQRDGSEKMYPGGSLIANPDGRIIAQGSETLEEIVYGYVYPEGSDDKRIGSYDIFASRRPETYKLLSQPYDQLPISKKGSVPKEPVKISAVQVSNCGNSQDTLKRSLALSLEASRSGCKILVLPELFLFDQSRISSDLPNAAKISDEALEEYKEFCKNTDSIVALNLIEARGPVTTIRYT